MGPLRRECPIACGSGCRSDPPSSISLSMPRSGSAIKMVLNVVANKDYPVTLTCTGCIFDNSKVVIPRGDRVAHSSVKVTSSKASLTADSQNLHQAVSDTVGVIFPIRSKFGSINHSRRARQESLYRFRSFIVDEHYNPATDGSSRKRFGLQVEGQGAVGFDPHAGALLSNGSNDQPGLGTATSGLNAVLPADECEADLVINSPTVGKSSVSVQSLDQRSEGKLTFRFHYPWPQIDLWMLFPGAIAGFLANFYVQKKQKLRWYWSLFSSILGAFILYMVGVWTFFESVSLLPTWPFALLWALLGGILGISAAKLATKLLTHGVNHGSEPELPSTS